MQSNFMVPEMPKPIPNEHLSRSIRGQAGGLLCPLPSSVACVSVYSCIELYFLSLKPCQALCLLNTHLRSGMA